MPWCCWLGSTPIGPRTTHLGAVVTPAVMARSRVVDSSRLLREAARAAAAAASATSAISRSRCSRANSSSSESHCVSGSFRPAGRIGRVTGRAAPVGAAAFGFALSSSSQAGAACASSRASLNIT